MRTEKNNGKPLPVLLGGDLNAYSVAKAFYLSRGLRSRVIAGARLGVMRGVSFIDLTVVEGLDDCNVAVPLLLSLAREKRGNRLLLIPCSDWYLQVVEYARDILEKHYYIHIPDFDTWRVVCDKSSFARLLGRFGIPHPPTEVIKTAEDLESAFQKIKGPYVLKPSDSSLYRRFIPGGDKVYFPKTKTQAEKIFLSLRASGFEGDLVLQTRALASSGKEVSSAVLTTYSDTEGRVRCAVRASVLIEERSRTARGNYAALITGDLDEISKKLCDMLDRIGYRGIANFDILYGSCGPVCLELNPRQGRSCDHILAAGINLFELILKESEGKTVEDIQLPKRVLWSIIDHRSAIKYADSDELKGEAIELLKNGAVASPFSCTDEESITRRIYDLIHKRRLTKRIKLEREMMT